MNTSFHRIGILLAAVVRSLPGKPGAIRLSAQADGLKGDVVSIRTR